MLLMNIMKAALLIGFGLIQAEVAAQVTQYPSRPVKIILGFNPGAATDLMARELAKKLGERWESPVVVENRSGANTIIATKLVAQAAPDGYTLLLSNSSNATNPAVFKNLPFDPKKDFTNISLLAIAYNLVTAAPEANIKSVKDLIKYAKNNPGKYTYGSVGVGSAQHLLMELLAKSADIQLTHVPYKGAAAAMVDVFGGRLTGMIGTISSQQTHVKAGKLQPLFVTGAKRSEILPNVETLAENGFSEIVSGYWLGLSGPAGMSPNLVKKINEDVNSVLKLPDFQEILKNQAMEVLGGSPGDMDAYFDKELVFWRNAMKVAELQPLDVAQ